jgi:hypothetical protein
MTRTLLAVLAAALWSTAALADAKPSEDEAKKVKAALTEWGCEAGTIEKESEATGVFEVDDAKCKGAQYDTKLDSAFKLISLSRD